MLLTNVPVHPGWTAERSYPKPWLLLNTILQHLRLQLQAYLRDIAGSTPNHHSKASHKDFFGFPVPAKVTPKKKCSPSPEPLVGLGLFALMLMKTWYLGSASRGAPALSSFLSFSLCVPAFQNTELAPCLSHLSVRI